MPNSGQTSTVAGLDDPNRRWLQQLVKVRAHPEWGVARVVRWYPCANGQPERLRVFAHGMRAQKVVAISEIDLVTK
jgi:hypothetical protein